MAAPTLSMKVVHFWFAAVVAVSISLASAQAEISVTAATDFLSDVDATLAKHDADKNGELTRAEMGDMAWMIFAIDSNRDGKLSRQELRDGMGKFSTQLFPSRKAEPSKQVAPPFEPAVQAARGPHPLKPADRAINRLIADVELTTLDGKPARLRSFTGKVGTAIAVLDPSCPISQRYFPVLARLEKTWREQGIGFLYVAASAAEEPENLRGLGALGLAAPIARDATGALLHQLKATRTTDVFLLDAAHTLIYRGAIDDQYGQGYSREAATQPYFVQALKALAAGERPRISATLAPGCELELPPAAPVSPGSVQATPGSDARVSQVRDPNSKGAGRLPKAAREGAAGGPHPSLIRNQTTWHNRISRIFQAHCEECHRPGSVAPFPLQTPEQVAKKAKTILRVVDDGTMPPWFAPPPPAGAHSLWKNDRLLPADDLRDLRAWLASDRPLGDPKDAPLPRSWPVEWRMGTPDAVLQLPKPIAIKAEGTMPYQTVMVPTNFAETRYVTAWEVRPTRPELVHHVLVYIYAPGTIGFPGVDERRGYLAAYVPGFDCAIYPDGMAKEIPAGSTLRFEIHYTPNGKAAEDQLRLGLKFGPEPAATVEVASIANVRLKIPPGAAAHPEAAQWRVPGDIRLLSLLPHMHVRGKAARFEVITPGGEPRTLVDFPRYDFNWQIPTQYADPPLIPRGSVLKVTGWFDNSAQNPANPDPTATVGWGSQTSDEMMIGYVEYYRVK